MIFLPTERMLFRKGVAYRLVQFDNGILRLLNKATRKIEELHFQTALAEYIDYRRRFDCATKPKKLGRMILMQLVPVRAVLPESTLEETHKRVKLLAKLEELGTFQLASRKKVRLAIAQATHEFRQSAPLTVTTVNRWYRVYAKAKCELQRLIAASLQQDECDCARFDPESVTPFDQLASVKTPFFSEDQTS
jgi:hypothetical protein